MSDGAHRDESAVGIARRAFALFFALLPGWILLALPVQVVAARVDEWILGGHDPLDPTPALLLRYGILFCWRAGVWSLLAVPLVRAAVAAEAGAAPNAWPYVLAPDWGRIARVASTFIVAMLAVMGGMILFVIPGIYLGLRLSMAPVAQAAAEGDGSGLGTSWALARGHLLHILGTLLAVGVPLVVVSCPFWIVAAASHNDIVDMVSTAITSCLGEVTTVALTLIYLRVRGETARSGEALRASARPTAAFE